MNAYSSILPANEQTPQRWTLVAAGDSLKWMKEEDTGRLQIKIRETLH